MRIIGVMIYIAALAACGGDERTSSEVGAETRDEVTHLDAIVDEFPERPEAEVVVAADFGAPCNTNTDCASGWCVEGPTGYICTNDCLEACPESFDCKSVQNGQGDVTFLCLPRIQRLCVPCLEDFQCNGGACLRIDGSGQCAAGCQGDDDCPSGYSCAPDATGAKPGDYCQPKSGSCACSTAFAGTRRTCIVENSLGTCYGVETCDPEIGWVDCTAQEPVPETCDYRDNDCDGDVDEDFKRNGIYADADTCGSCDIDCDEVLANALETECALIDGDVRCRVVGCKPGFNPVNPFVCAPETGNLCQPCDTAATCIGTGAACTQLDDGKFCTRGCVANSCPVGFDCLDTPAGQQCLPTSGSCTCDGSNLDLARACTKTLAGTEGEPDVVCKGFEPCTAEGWGECDLPNDLCDGIDNDCDGVIDGPFKTDGRYSAVEHCGACDISCLVLERPNAAPTCVLEGPVPTCGIRCIGDAVDVNGESNDGCECIPTSTLDLAGDDIDSNCDGVDGEVENAIFVSKDGDDTNPGTRELPLYSLAHAITTAATNGKRDVYVATGVFTGSLRLADGVGLFGGYSPEFDRHDALVYETALIGTFGDDHFGTVDAIDLGATNAARDTVLDGFTIFGVAAGNVEGGNSYAIYLRNVGPRMRVSNNRVLAGAAGNGGSGTRGVDGQSGADGFPGAGARNLASDCTTVNETNGGSGGTRLCGAADVSGGKGGRAMCPRFEESPTDVARGDNGKGTSAGFGGAFGWPMLICAAVAEPYCPELACNTCKLPRGDHRYNAFSGTNGGNGSDGQKGNGGSGGATTTGTWIGSRGADGTAGNNGAGGGGGGAAGGVEVTGEGCELVGNDDMGGAGGGGGAGGCLGTGGTGGGAGGGSFGIFVLGANVSHVPVIVGNTIIGGRGGAGGAGGAGGVGGTAGRGGRGGGAGEVLGQTARCSQSGGDGGNGGNGGHGGGGGGGAGGPSYGLYTTLPNGVRPPSWKTDNTFTAGQGGPGGAGGVSVEQTRSGTAGGNGVTGTTNY